jgi:hypothetical protein
LAHSYPFQGTSQRGGKRAYSTRIGKGRSTRYSCRSIATPKQASPPFPDVRAWAPSVRALSRGK